MIFFDGIYRLGRQRKGEADLTCAYASAWRVRIIDFSASHQEMKHIRSIAVVASQTGDGIFKTSCVESVGKKICRDFNLCVVDVLWVEIFKNDPENLYVASFKPKGYNLFDVVYDISWRKAAPNEREAVCRFITEI